MGISALPGEGDSTWTPASSGFGAGLSALASMIPGGQLAGPLISGIAGLFGGQSQASAAMSRQQQAQNFSAQQQQAQDVFNAQQADVAFGRQQELQSEAQGFNAQQAQLNRDWQQQMSNTAYQRQVADMKAAGLNPILAAGGGGGASTPSGGVASSGAGSAPQASGGVVGSPGAAQAFNPIGSAISSALEAGRFSQEQTRTDAVAENLRHNNMLQDSQSSKQYASAAVDAANQKLLDAAWVNARKQGNILDSQAMVAQLEARKAGMDLQFYKPGGWGESSYQFNQWMRAAQPGLNNALSLSQTLTPFVPRMTTITDPKGGQTSTATGVDWGRIGSGAQSLGMGMPF